MVSFMVMTESLYVQVNLILVDVNSKDLNNAFGKVRINQDYRRRFCAD